ncbi:MAG: hypothetical protein ACI8W3_003596 [Myxococcota bacterium]|jgi:hypothetical protein
MVATFRANDLNAKWQAIRVESEGDLGDRQFESVEDPTERKIHRCERGVLRYASRRAGVEQDAVLSQ